MIKQAVTPTIPIDNFLKGLVNDTLNTMRQIVTLQKRLNALINLANRLATLIDQFFEFGFLELGSVFSALALITTTFDEIRSIRRQLRDQKQHLKNNLILLREVT